MKLNSVSIHDVHDTTSTSSKMNRNQFKYNEFELTNITKMTLIVMQNPHANPVIKSSNSSLSIIIKEIQIT